MNQSKKICTVDVRASPEGLLLGLLVGAMTSEMKERRQIERILWKFLFEGVAAEDENGHLHVGAWHKELYVTLVLEKESKKLRQVFQVLCRACASTGWFEKVLFDVAVIDTIWYCGTATSAENGF